MSRLLALLFCLAAAMTGTATVVAFPAAADPISACTSSTGVLVAVDFRHFGGQITRGCDVSITTGLDALHDAGFTTAGTVHDGDGFVCRIDGLPNAKQEACFNTPPADAYWSYWHADAGQSTWTYSRAGAQSTHPASGSIDAWVFGATDIAGGGGGPRFTPAQVRAGSPTTSAPVPAPQTHRAHQPVVRPNPHHVSARTVAPTQSPSAGGSRRSSSTAPRPARSVPRSSAPGTPSPPAGSSTAPLIVNASPVSGRGRPGAGPVLPVVVGLALVVLLGGGAGWTVLRRRRLDSTDR